MNHSNWFTIKIAGVDTSKYLQGQLPINLEKLEDLTSSFSFISVHTGKVIAVYRLVKISNELIYILVYKEDQTTELLEHLKKFAIFSKVNFEVSPANIAFSLNPDIASKAQEELTHIKSLSDSELKIANLAAQVTYNENQVYRIQTRLGLIIYFTDPTNSTELTVPENEATLNETQFLSLSAYFGIDYNLITANRNKFLPQALGFDLGVENCISYNKGCYQGQEGIARAKYRGANPHIHQQFKVANPNIFKTKQVDDILNPEQYELALIMSEDLETSTAYDLANITLKKTGTVLSGYIINNQDNKYQHLIPVNTQIVIFNTLISKKLATENQKFTIYHVNSLKPMALIPY